MQIALIPVTLYLILYAPGHYWLRPHGGARPNGSQLLREVLLSAACTSWFGFLLAELGWYSLPALLGGLALVACIGCFLRRGDRAAYGVVDLRGIVVFALTCAWVAPPLDTRILGSDSSGYLAGGAYLARHGSIIIHDPTIAALSPDLKRTLFPSVAPDRGSPPYLRLMGSMILRSLDGDEVLLAFHHLITIWIAVFHALAGPAAAQWAATLFAGLSMWAMTEFAAVVAGATVSWMFLPLLLLLAPQYWYSRFLMPEVPGQFFMWAGLWCLAVAERGVSRRDAYLAGVAFGVAGLMRIENAAFLAFVLLLALCFDRTRAIHTRPALLCALPFWLHAGIHLMVFRTHYYGHLLSLLTQDSGLRGPLLASVALAAAIAVGTFLWKRFRRNGPLQTLVFSVLFAWMLCLAVWGDYQHQWSTLELLLSFGSAPVVVAGGIGMLFGTRQIGKRPVALQLLMVLAVVAFTQVMLEPHATPVAIWAIRRGVTVVLPAMCLSLALLAHWMGQRWHWAVGVALVGGALTAEFPAARHLWEQPYYRGSLRQVEAVATFLPPGAVVLYDGQLIGSGFASVIWTLYDTPAYFFAFNDTKRIGEIEKKLPGTPLYWMSQGNSQPPHGDGITSVPVAFYEFALTTPQLDTGPSSTTSFTWDYSVALYALRSERQK